MLYLRIFAYDCEVGIWTDSHSHMTHTTSGNTYQIDLCMSLKYKEGKKNLCGSYLFRMPKVEDIEPENEWDDLVLLEKDPLLKDKTVVLHFPLNYDGPRNVVLLKTELMAVKEEKEVGSRILIKQFSSPENTSRISFDVIDYIEPGFQYEIVLTENDEKLIEGSKWNNNKTAPAVATFSIDLDNRSNRRSSLAVVVVLLLAITALAAILGYMQYLRVKRNHKVNPKR